MTASAATARPMKGPAPVTAAAPLRLDFAGGWTDVAPFAVDPGGTVVNAAIRLHACAVVTPANEYELRSDDLDRSVHPGTAADFQPNGDLDLLKVAVAASGVGPCRVRTRCDAPPGSGLGSSGAMSVALVAALHAARSDAPPLSPPDVAETAWRLETVGAGLPGGKQDQYAAALGGFHRLRFRDGQVRVEALAVPQPTREALAERLLVCHTGQSRVSSNTIARVMSRYARGDAGVTSALGALAEIAERMAEALEAGDLARIGALLSENWRQQQRLDPDMQTETMRRLAADLARVGVLGGKAAGAGAGGSMLFLLEGSREEATRAATARGATVLPVEWCAEGVRVW